MRRFQFSRVLVSGLSSGFIFAQTAPADARQITVDVKQTTGPVDHFFNRSLRSDWPGTLIRDDSQAQLKTVTDELGFRYIRFMESLRICRAR